MRVDPVKENYNRFELSICLEENEIVDVFLNWENVLLVFVLDEQHSKNK